jgi:transposase-like protein
LKEVFVVKRKRFSVEQIAAVLKQAELGMPVADVIRQTGISEQTFYRWKRMPRCRDCGRGAVCREPGRLNARHTATGCAAQSGCEHVCG